MAIEPLELQTAIAGIRELTAALESLRAARAECERVFGWKRAREMFKPLDVELAILRKALRKAMR